MSDFGVDVLAFGPHPDDVELFCGGVLIRMADLGHTTGVVDLTRGERASHGTPEERARETAAATAILGLQFRENLALPDTGLEPSSRDQLAKVVGAIRRHRPEIVLVPWVEERHPDHVAAAELVTKAVFYAGVRKFDSDAAAGRHVPRQVLHYQLRHRMPPTFVVDTSAAQDRKLAAIRCYSSQITRPPNGDATLVSSSRAVDSIDARDRYVGSLIGVAHGEALRSVLVPGLVDPVAHFRQNPFSEAHAFEPIR